MAKHTVVEFVLDEISTLTLDGFSEQNVMFGLSIGGIQKGFRLKLDPCCDYQEVLRLRA